jgi:hypothetical protein
MPFQTLMEEYIANFITHILFKSFPNITFKPFRSAIKKGTQDLLGSALLICGSFHESLSKSVLIIPILYKSNTILEC